MILAIAVALALWGVRGQIKMSRLARTAAR
jgi:hypothetical protein